jgi:hypothetical protein
MGHLITPSQHQSHKKSIIGCGFSTEGTYYTILLETKHFSNIFIIQQINHPIKTSLERMCEKNRATTPQRNIFRKNKV